jgi:hypothetical protein
VKAPYAQLMSPEIFDDLRKYFFCKFIMRGFYFSTGIQIT